MDSDILTTAVDRCYRIGSISNMRHVMLFKDLVAGLLITVLAVDILYLYYTGAWHDPVKWIEMTEVVILYILIIGGIAWTVYGVKRQGNQPPCKQTPKATEQTCKICGVADGLNFTVADEDWEAIVNPEMQSKVICLKHFDKMAYNARKDYTITELYFAGIKKGLKFIPIPFTPNSKGEAVRLTPAELEEAILNVTIGWADGTPDDDDITIPRGVADAATLKAIRLLSPSE